MISTEISYEEEDPGLHEVVIKNMIHGLLWNIEEQLSVYEQQKMFNAFSTGISGRNNYVK